MHKCTSILIQKLATQIACSLCACCIILFNFFFHQMTVETVKDKLWKKCGTSVESLCLELYDDTSAKVSDLADNARPLGFYSPQDGLVLILYLAFFFCLRFLDLPMVLLTFLINLFVIINTSTLSIINIFVYLSLGFFFF